MGLLRVWGRRRMIDGEGEQAQDQGRVEWKSGVLCKER